MNATASQTCYCMTEDLHDGLGERVVTHSLRCSLHPEYVEHKCPGCGRSFKTERGLTTHRSARFVAMGCKR